MHHTVVLSDVHFCEAEPSDGLWMRYRQRAFSPQGAVSEMLDAMRARVAPDDDLEVVLNGDIFDFDAPHVVDNESRFHDLPRDAEHAVPVIEAILADHAAFVEALGRIVRDGGRVVFVSGNHDVQLTLPEVRAAITERVVAAALAADGAEPTDERRAALRARVAFRAWFHKTSDGVLIEHGHQYDAYCCYRYPMAPFGQKAREIHPTMGSLTTRHLASRMGYFNPHVEGSYMLSVFGYVAHWARYYLLSRRSLAFVWAAGAVRTVVRLWQQRMPERRADRRANIAAAARETGAPVRAIARHARLFARPAEDRLAMVARELWLDRVVLFIFAILFGAVWMIASPLRLWPGALLGAALIAIYEVAAPAHSLDAIWSRVGRRARAVGRVHAARAVVFGHTHRSDGAWEHGVFYGNTGSWSAAYLDIACTRPLSDERPLVWLRSDGKDAPLVGGLYAWKNGCFEPRVVREPTDTSLSPSDRDHVAHPIGCA